MTICYLLHSYDGDLSLPLGLALGSYSVPSCGRSVEELGRRL